MTMVEDDGETIQASDQLKSREDLSRGKLSGAEYNDFLPPDHQHSDEMAETSLLQGRFIPA